jgi:nitroreductase
MEVFDAINSRRSVRRFSSRQVGDEKIQKLLEAVRWSPSWANMQCWRFIVVREPSTREKISELTNVESFFAPRGYRANPAMKGIAEAPVVIVACADPAQSGELRSQEYYMTDLGIASQTLMLATTAMGLGTVLVGVFDEETLRGLLRIPPEIRTVGIFPIGYPMEEAVSEPNTRKPLDEIVFNGRWGE